MLNPDARAAAQSVQLLLLACQWMIASRFFIQSHTQRQVHIAHPIKATVTLHRYTIILEFLAGAARNLIVLEYFEVMRASSN